MRFAKIAEKVALVTCGRKTFTDKGQTYSEAQWPKGHFDDLLRRGFLVLVEGEEKAIENPDETAAAPKMQKKVITKADLKANPDLKELGVKVGDEIEVPVEEEETPSEVEGEEL